MNPTPSATRFLSLLLMEDLETLAQELTIKTNDETVSLVEERLLELYQQIQSCKRSIRSMEARTTTTATTTTTTTPRHSKPLTGRLLVPASPDDDSTAISNITTDTSTPTLPYNRWKHTDGMIRRVPQEWKFPFCTLDRAYIWWHCGGGDKIGPLKGATSADFLHVQRGNKNFIELRTVMTLIDDCLQQEHVKGVMPQQYYLTDVMDPSQALVLFQKFQTLHQQGKGAFYHPELPTRRPLDRLKWTSVVTLLSKAKRLRRGALASSNKTRILSSKGSNNNNNNNNKRVRACSLSSGEPPNSPTGSNDDSNNKRARIIMEEHHHYDPHDETDSD